MRFSREYTQTEHFPRPTTNHEDVLPMLRECALYSVIVEWYRPEEHVFEDPRVYRKTPVCRPSPWEMEYRRQVYFRPLEEYEDFRERINKHFPEDIEGSREKRSHVLSDFIVGFTRKKYVEIFDAAILEWAWGFFDEDEIACDDDGVIELAKERYPEEYKQWYQEFALPTLTWTYEPKKEVVFEQFPFMSLFHVPYGITQLFIGEKNNELFYEMGSTSGSGTRETLGYYGYAFQQLQNEGKDIPSIVLLVNSKTGIAECQQESPRLIIYPPHFGCNYKIERGKGKEILRGACYPAGRETFED